MLEMRSKYKNPFLAYHNVDESTYISQYNTLYINFIIVCSDDTRYSASEGSVATSDSQVVCFTPHLNVHVQHLSVRF